MLHLIVDNASSHDVKAVRDYLAKRPKRFEVHYTPTHSSWLNLVERWFSESTTKRIRRGSFASVEELEHAIMDYIYHWNESDRRFVWMKSSKQMLHNVRKAAQN
jgi:transposase